MREVILEGEEKGDERRNSDVKGEIKDKREY